MASSTPAAQYSVVVAGGGTAGHIEPALAVADALRERGVHVTALGSTKGLEQDIVPARGYDLRLIDPVPVPRKPNRALFQLPGRVQRAVRQTKKVLSDVRADAVIGFGGYVSAPAYLAAKSAGLLFYIHEANAKAGLANRLGAKLGGSVFTATPTSGLKGQLVGVPIRKDLSHGRDSATAQRGRAQWGLDEDRSTVLVTGGSQGAASLNAALAGALDALTEQGFQVLHAYGKKNEAPAAHEKYVALPYVTDMAAAYAVADLIVCRSGAMTVAEVTAAGLPAIYVPLPHGNGEQGLNAQSSVAAGAAVLVPDAELSSQRLFTEINRIFSHPEVFDQMAKAAGQQAESNAADVIADRILSALDNAAEG